MFGWDGITEFVAVAETGSFTSAAARLGISTAQVSRQIGGVEKRLAIKLFYRTTRKVTITETGQVYYNHCRHLLDGLAEAEQAITNLQSTPTGKLTLTAPVTYGENRIAPLVHDFLQLYPDLSITLSLTNRRLDLVAEGYDLAIRLGQLEDSSLMATRLGSRTSHVCASPDYLAKHGMPESLVDLHQHNCIKGTLDHWRFVEQGKVQHMRVEGNLQCNNGWALVDAALKGLGLIQLPDYYIADKLAKGELISVLDPYRLPEDGIWAIYPHNRHLSPKVRLLIDHLRDGLGKQAEKPMVRTPITS